MDLFPIDELSSAPELGVAKAFPEAEGFGAYAKGGRGGSVVYVETTKDYCSLCGESVIPGSLRWAVESLSGPRTILFKVGGVIELKNYLTLSGEDDSYLTIAGQTAPGGITLSHYPVFIQDSAHDIVIRYIRVRDFFVEPDLGSSMDGISFYGRTSSNKVNNIIIDHCSIAWAIDENAGSWQYVENFTFQWCAIVEGATYGHIKGPHSKAYLSGGSGSEGLTQGSIHHNLFAHNGGRNPLLSGGKIYDFRNNIIYNWNNNNAAQIMADMSVNFVNNFYIEGADVSDLGISKHIIQVSSPDSAEGLPRLFVKGNIGPLRFEQSQDEWDIGVVYYNYTDDVYYPCGGDPNVLRCPADKGVYGLASEVVAPSVTTQSASDALGVVLDGAGASFPARDNLDSRIVNEINYVLGRYSDAGNPLKINVPRYGYTADNSLGKFGPNDGKQVLVEVLLQKINISGDYPKQQIIKDGQSEYDTRMELLYKISITSGERTAIANNESAWAKEERTIPGREHVRATIEGISVPFNADFDGDGTFDGWSSEASDSDLDGMPDRWENVNGYNLSNNSDGNSDSDGDGYTNLEEYLNELPYGGFTENPVCGNGNCESSLGESCSSCSADCGSCPPPPGGGGGGNGNRNGNGNGDENVSLPPPVNESCAENWLCDDNWSECHEDGTQMRQCADIAACGTELNKPLTTQLCTPEEAEQSMRGTVVVVAAFVAIIGAMVIIVLVRLLKMPRDKQNTAQIPYKLDSE